MMKSECCYDEQADGSGRFLILGHKSPSVGANLNDPFEYRGLTMRNHRSCSDPWFSCVSTLPST